MTHRAVLPLLIVLGVYAGAPRAAVSDISQTTPCRPPTPPPSTQPNIFSEEQETDLGDAIAESIAPQLRIIHDDPLTANLRRIGERLARHLPPTKLKLQYFLVDLSELNAFVLPGGRIYVARKLVGFTKDEDELAGVLAHEMGHLIARQQTITMTRYFREVLNVTQVGDRQDIFEKYNRLTDNAMRRPGVFRRTDSHEGRDQIEADRLGLFVTAAAGYDPQAHARLFDRYSETKGNTGSFLSDLFGTTAPESRRLRELLRTGSSIPQNCMEARPAAAAEAYRQWQDEVAAFIPAGRAEAVHNVLSRVELQPALRGDITHLRFSADGTFILAQDDAGITVLTREPFAPLFRIPAPEALPAEFSGDSRQITFHNTDLRVEIWDIASRKLARAHDLVVRSSCWQTELAPDGRTLACLDSDFSLSLFDVASGTTLLQKKNFYLPNPIVFYVQMMAVAEGFSDAMGELVGMDFSPDSRYFAAGYRSPAMIRLGIGSEDDAILFDVNAKAVVPLKSPAKRLLMAGFTFLGSDRIVGFNPYDSRNSGVISLPSGEVTQRMLLSGGRLEGATRGEFVFVRPFQKYAVAVTDLVKGQIVKGSTQSAVDLFGDVFIAERATGELGLYSVSDNQLKSATTLPAGTLGRLRATAISADLKYVAASERSRGGVWDLATGTRVFHVRGFRGATFDKDGSFLADFPKDGDEPRRIVRFDAAARSLTPLGEIKEDLVTQFGPVMLVRTPLEKEGSLQMSMRLEARDTRTAASLWSRPFAKEPPRVWADPDQQTVVLVWPASATTARDEARKNPELGKQLSALKEKEGDYLVQVLDLSTGTPRGALFVETGKGSFRLTDVTAAGDTVLVVDDSNRVLVYSLSTGHQLGRAFGSQVAASGTSRLLSVENAAGQLTLYELSTMQKKDEFTFSSNVMHQAFSPDGRKLFVLTGNQTAYVLDVSK